MAASVEGQLWFSNRRGFQDFTLLQNDVLEVLYHFKPNILIFDGVSASTLNFARNVCFEPYRLIYVSSEELKSLDPSKQFALTREH
jgi:hypothetical protein